MSSAYEVDAIYPYAEQSWHTRRTSAEQCRGSALLDVDEHLGMPSYPSSAWDIRSWLIQLRMSSAYEVDCIYLIMLSSHSTPWNLCEVQHCWMWMCILRCHPLQQCLGHPSSWINQLRMSSAYEVDCIYLIMLSSHGTPLEPLRGSALLDVDVHP